jgi:ribosomal protein S1
MEDFEALLNESFEMDTPAEGSVVKGKVIAIEAGQAIIDVGYKMEGRIDLKEFSNPAKIPTSRSAMRSRCFCVRSKTPVAKLSSRARWPAAKKRGTVWKRPMPAKTVSMARSLAA